MSGHLTEVVQTGVMAAASAVGAYLGQRVNVARLTAVVWDVLRAAGLVA